MRLKNRGFTIYELLFILVWLTFSIGGLYLVVRLIMAAIHWLERN